MLPMRGEEPWKEAKVAVVFREENYLSHREANRGQVTQARYVATLGGQDVFEPKLQQPLQWNALKMQLAWRGWATEPPAIGPFRKNYVPGLFKFSIGTMLLSMP